MSTSTSIKLVMVVDFFFVCGCCILLILNMSVNLLKKIFQKIRHFASAVSGQPFRDDHRWVCQARQFNYGFTILEMMVVIAIIGIVSGIVTASISDSKAKGRDAKRIADISVIQLALENYYDRNSEYPTSLSNLVSFDSSVPIKDPSSGNDYSYVALECSGGIPDIPYSYHLGTTLELDNSILNDDMDQDFNSTSVSNCGGMGFNGSESKSYDVQPKF